MDEPDPQIVAAARDGDLRAFEQLVRRYQGEVWRLCFHLVHSDSLADDITQDAFVRAYRFLSRYRGDSKFSTWLFTITRNCAYDELRRIRRRSRLAQQARDEFVPSAADGSSAIEIRELVGRLPLELREPLVLIDMFGLSYAEVAQIAGSPVGTIKSRVHRAREALALAFESARQEARGED